MSSADNSTVNATTTISSTNSTTATTLGNTTTAELTTAVSSSTTTTTTTTSTPPPTCTTTTSSDSMSTAASASSAGGDGTTSRQYFPYETPPDSLWFLWEFLLLAAVYIFIMLIFVLIVFILITYCLKPLHPPHVPPTPHYEEVEEVKLSADNQKLLGVGDVTSAFMVASEMGRKFHSSQTIELVLEEEEVICPPEPEVEPSRPGSGILQETLEEIAPEAAEEGPDAPPTDGGSDDVPDPDSEDAKEENE